MWMPRVARSRSCRGCLSEAFWGEVVAAPAQRSGSVGVDRSGDRTRSLTCDRDAETAMRGVIDAVGGKTLVPTGSQAVVGGWAGIWVTTRVAFGTVIEGLGRGLPGRELVARQQRTVLVVMVSCSATEVSG